MRIKLLIVITALTLIWSCRPSIEKTVDLNVQNWIHGSENCDETIDPPIQVVKDNLY